MRKTLDELLDYIQPQPYIVHSENYNHLFKTPVLTAGQTFVLGKTNETDGIYTASKINPIILFDDFTTACKWVDFPFKVKSSACKIIIPKTGTNIRYCYYAMKSIKFDASQHKRYWISQYSKLGIPSYGPQKENLIADSLDCISSLIEKKKAEISSLDSLVKSRFMEMFGDPILNNRNWPINTVANCCYMKGMKNIPQKEKYWLLNLDKIESNTGEIIKKDYVVKDKIGNSTFFFDKDYVLYSKLRPYLNKVVIPNESGFATSELVPLKPNSFVNAVYLAHLLRSKSFVKWIDGTSSGAKMPRASVDALRSFMLPLPPIELQNKFADFVHLVQITICRSLQVLFVA